jgi:hypothetical protein
MGKLLKFNEFVNEELNNTNREEKEKLVDLGLDKYDTFRDAFSVLDFFGGALPHSYHKAKEAALDGGYELSMDLWQEALMMSLDGEQSEEDTMYEATAAEVAAKRAALEQEEANVAKARVDLAAKKSAIKPDQADALNAKAAIEAEEAKLAQQDSDIARRKGELAKTPITA